MVVHARVFTSAHVFVPSIRLQNGSKLAGASTSALRGRGLIIMSGLRSHQAAYSAQVVFVVVAEETGCALCRHHGFDLLRKTGQWEKTMTINLAAPKQKAQAVPGMQWES